jgi:non-heme chloroperoxidase
MKSFIVRPLLLMVALFVVFAEPVYAREVNESSKLRFSEIQLKTGIRMHYAEQGDRSGPVIVMLHGFTDSWFSYSRVLPLIDPKYHVYVLDQRGHGNSDRPQEGYTPRNFAEDVLAFMESKELKKVTVVGHSMGSFVAQYVAALAPKRVNNLVLIGSAASARNSAVKELQQAINSLSDRVSEEFIRDFQTGTVAQPVPEEFMNSVVKESQKLPVHVWKAVINDLVADAGAELNNIESPTLIIWGDRETVFLRAEQDALLSGIPNARLRVYEGTGHSPTWEQPERLARDLQDFITR